MLTSNAVDDALCNVVQHHHPRFLVFRQPLRQHEHRSFDLGCVQLDATLAMKEKGLQTGKSIAMIERAYMRFIPAALQEKLARVREP